VERHLVDWLVSYLDGDLDAAARAAFAAHTRAPDSPELRVVAGQAALWTGKVAVALQLLGSIDTAGVSPASDVGYWNDLTSALHLAGQHQRERENAHGAELRFPELLAPTLFTMRALVALGQVDSVLLKLAELSERRGEPGWSPAQIAVDISELLEARGHHSAARRAAAIGLSQIEADTATGTTETRVTRAHLMHRAGQSAAALDTLDTILDAEASTARVHGLAGVIATLLQRHTAAHAAALALEQSADTALATYWRARMAAARQDGAASARLLAEARRRGLPHGVKVQYLPELPAGPS
jgi:hypothetical protein